MDSINNNKRHSSISYYEFENYVYDGVVPPPPPLTPESSEERLSFLGCRAPRSRSSKYGTHVVQVNEEETNLNAKIEEHLNNVTTPFKSKFAPSQMRQLALVAHNHMKPAMATFIKTYSEILKKFRITGTQTTMLMCKQLWGEDNPDIEYGLSCTSGPLGGDAQVAALMCMEDLGGIIFFTDPLSVHPHQADIDALIRLGNVGNIIMCSNPTSAMSMMHTFKFALEKGNHGAIPSFFETFESPAVATYKLQQQLALQTVVGQHHGNKFPNSDHKEDKSNVEQ